MFIYVQQVNKMDRDQKKKPPCTIIFQCLMRKLDHSGSLLPEPHHLNMRFIALIMRIITIGTNPGININNYLQKVSNHE